MPDTTVWIHAVRSSHDRLAALLGPLTAEQVEAPSYASEWSIAQVASHLGSQAEIFALFLDAGRTGAPAPGSEVFGPIWDRWNGLAPAKQVTESIAANEAFVTSLEQVPVAEPFTLSMFGTDLDLAGLAALRLGEHAVHAWDIAVALDPSATVAPDAVALLIDTIDRTAARSGKPLDDALDADPIVIETTAPHRRLLLTLHPAVSLTADTGSGDALRLPAEAFVRLVFGRLDPDHSPVDDARLAQLRTVFPGF
jgi:uncharacterized protein (TIGR03083 family)